MGGPTHNRRGRHGTQSGNDADAERECQDVVRIHESAPSLHCFLLSTTTAAAEVIESDWAGAEKDQSKCDGGQGERELVVPVSGKAVFPVHFGDGYTQVNDDAERGEACQKTN